jgi:hypothetical protein
MLYSVRSPAACMFFMLLLLACETIAEEPKKPDETSDAKRAAQMVPAKIAGTYQGGELVELRVRNRMAYVVKPSGTVDPEKRWLWEFPFWLGINDGFDNLQHRNYVEAALAAGFHVAGIDVGPSCGSPAAAEVCQAFYDRMISEYGLHKRARIMGQSHGGPDRIRLGVSASGVRRPHCRHLPRNRFSELADATQRSQLPGQGLGLPAFAGRAQSAHRRGQPDRQPCTAGKDRRQDSSHSWR